MNEQYSKYHRTEMNNVKNPELFILLKAKLKPLKNFLQGSTGVYSMSQMSS